jgi:hypothetical protein
MNYFSKESSAGAGSNQHLHKLTGSKGSPVKYDHSVLVVPPE